MHLLHGQNGMILLWSAIGDTECGFVAEKCVDENLYYGVIERMLAIRRRLLFIVLKTTQ